MDNTRIMRKLLYYCRKLLISQQVVVIVAQRAMIRVLRLGDNTTCEIDNVWTIE